MKIKSFFEFVEIQTKVASIFPFLFGVLYAKYTGYDINLINTMIMLISLLCLDMATTAINNYVDFKKAINNDYKNNINVIGTHKLPIKLSKVIIFCLLGLCILFGLMLVYRTDIVVLLLGMFSFFVGVCYTYGPVPISRTPFGEVVSGIVMGFFIVFLSFYIQNTNIIDFNINSNLDVLINFNLLQILNIFLVSLPFILVISNIMLGNNMRDLEVDVKNDRHVLPYYIGLDKSFLLFKINYLLIYFVIIIGVLIGVLPYASLLVLITIIKVWNNTKRYKEEVIINKNPRGFKNVVINMMIISVIYILSLIIALLI